MGIITTITVYYTSPNQSKFSLGQVFVNALFLPLSNLVMLLVFSFIPVVLGILPPAFQTYPGEGMSFIGAFRGIPESMSPIVGPAAFPIAEMFYSFWGGLYGASIASTGF